MSFQTPMPTQYIVPIPVNQIQLAEEDPLLSGKRPYAPYNPKKIVIYAKKSRAHCCCVVFALTSCLCCCLFFLVSLVLGAFIAAYATQCANRTSDTLTFTAPVANVTSMHFISSFGDVTITRAESFNPNVTITIAREAASQVELNNFSSNFTVTNGTLRFEQAGPQNWKYFWEALMLCQSASLTIQLPNLVDTQKIDFSVYSQNGHIVMNLTNPITLHSLNLSSSNSRLELDGANVTGDISLISTNGKINLGSVRATALYAHTTNGKIDLGSVTAAGIDAQTTNGQITSEQAITLYGNSTFTAVTTNAKIELQQVSASSRSIINLQSTNGKVTSTFNGFAGTFDAETTNGDVQVHGNVKFSVNDSSQKKGTVGVGAGQLHAQSTNGMVELSFK